MKECCNCNARRKERDETEYKLLLNRLSRIEGQVRGVKRMVEESAYCPDILTQVSAIRSALDSFSRELLSNHVKTCVISDLKEDRLGTVDELICTIEKMM